MLNLILRSQTSMQKVNCKKQEKCVVIAFFLVLNIAFFARAT